MALIVEDGSIVTGADSYVSRADYIAYAAILGVTIASTDATDIQLRKAAQFINEHEGNLKGDRVERDQPMSFPRNGVVIDGWTWNGNEIPRQVTLAQMNIALDINAGYDPYNPAVNPGRATKREKVEGAVEVEYMGEGKGQKLSRTSKADALLSSLLLRSGLFGINSIRA